MALDEETAIVVWPEYFDIRRTRAQGRRVSRALAVQDPTVDKIAKALAVLRLEFKIETDKAYPKSWYNHSGRILVENTLPKAELLRRIAQKMPRG